jgi:hypothetical protein
LILIKGGNLNRLAFGGHLLSSAYLTFTVLFCYAEWLVCNQKLAGTA